VINRPNVKKKKVFFFANYFSQNHIFAIVIVTNIVKKIEKNTDFSILKKNFVWKIKELQNLFFSKQLRNNELMKMRKNKTMINRLSVKKKKFFCKNKLVKITNLPSL
jgi:hypothetical protein